jgi:hypothetical protein
MGEARWGGGCRIEGWEVLWFGEKYCTGKVGQQGGKCCCGVGRWPIAQREEYGVGDVVYKGGRGWGKDTGRVGQQGGEVLLWSGEGGL